MENVAKSVGKNTEIKIQWNIAKHTKKQQNIKSFGWIHQIFQNSGVIDWNFILVLLLISHGRAENEIRPTWYHYKFYAIFNGILCINDSVPHRQDLVSSSHAHIATESGCWSLRFTFLIVTRNWFTDSRKFLPRMREKNCAMAWNWQL